MSDQGIDVMGTIVPMTYVEYLRIFIGDDEAFNKLIKGRESSDQKLALALMMFVEHFNAMPPDISETYRIDNFPNKSLLIHGAAVEALQMAGIIQSRNFLNFNDAGVSFSVSDKAGDYQQWANLLASEARQTAIETKIKLNAEEAYDFHHSPDGFGYWNGY